MDEKTHHAAQQTSAVNEITSTPDFDEMNPRVWAEVINSILVLLSALCFLVQLIKRWRGEDGSVAGILFCVFAVLACLSFAVIVRKNLSWLLMKRLLSEVNVVLVLLFSLCNLVLDCVDSPSKYSPAYSVMLFVITFGCICLDAICAVSVYFSLFVRLSIVTFIGFNSITYFFTRKGCGEADDSIFENTNGKISWVELKRIIFVDLFLLLVTAAFVGSRDQEQQYISFPIGCVVKKQRTHRRRMTLSAWLFSGNHLAETLALVASLISLILFVANIHLAALIVVVFPILIVIVVIMKGNMDKAVLRLLARQFCVIVIVVIMLLDFVFNAVFHSNAAIVMGSFAFCMIVFMNISFDAVRVMSHFFRVCSTLLVAATCISSVRINLEENPCKQSDWLLKHTNNHLSVVQLQRLVSFTVIVMHIRPWLLIVFVSHAQSLYFVTAKVQKQFVETCNTNGVLLNYSSAFSAGSKVNTSTTSVASSNTNNHLLEPLAQARSEIE